MQTIILAIVLILLILLIIHAKLSKKSEPYSSCCRNGCEGVCTVDLYQPKDFIFENPFRRPFSASMYPQQAIYDQALLAVQQSNIKK